MKTVRFYREDGGHRDVAVEAGFELQGESLGSMMSFMRGTVRAVYAFSLLGLWTVMVPLPDGSLDETVYVSFEVIDGSAGGGT